MKVSDAIRDGIESHYKNTGEMPERITVAPLVYKLLETELEKMCRYVPDEDEVEDATMHIEGVRVKLDNDKTAVEFDNPVGGER